MDYEKRYRDLIKRLKEERDGDNDYEPFCHVANEILDEFGENESEDERIRKDIVSHFESIKAQALYDNQEMSYDIISSCNEKISYLEKQKDNKFVPRVLPCSAAWFEDGEEKLKENPKSADSIPPDCASNARCPYKIHGDEDFIGDIKDTPAYHFGFDEGVRSEREKQKEQKPAEWSESDTVMCNAALELLRSHPNLMASHGINKSSVIRWLQSFRPQKQGFIDDICSKAGIAIPYLDGNQWCILKGDNIQSGVVGFGGTKEDALANFIKDVPIPQQWSEEDELMLTAVIQTLERFCGRGTTGMQIDWLKSLRPQPQKVYEQTVRSILTMCDSYEQNGTFTDGRARDFLGNVRVKCKDAIDCAPILDESSWKPSEEQMGALKEALETYKGLEEYDAMKSLYNELKKLM